MALKGEKKKEYQKEYRAKNKEKIAQANREYREKNKEKRTNTTKEYRDKNKDKIKEYAWKRAGINITQKEYEGLLVEQNYSCAICDKHQSVLNKTLAVDHDHETGEIRGLLCWECNTALGKLGDSIPGILKVLEYLQKGENRNE